MESALPGALFSCHSGAVLKSRMEEGSGAFGARVLSVMCCALTDGFGPGRAAPSGLVQRGVICRLLTAAVKRL